MYLCATALYCRVAVDKFLEGCTVPEHLYNKSGRGFPDVSAVGWNFEYVVNGVVGHVGGTSASSPTFAAVLSVLNSARLAAGKPTFGWINPWLYHAAAASASAFHDVVDGNNACISGHCGGTVLVFSTFFATQKECYWDSRCCWG
jgi:tripeptidyl-peptidase-1